MLVKGANFQPWGMDKTGDIMGSRRTIASNTVLNIGNTLKE